MINDKEFLAFQDGIFKPLFEKYIEYRRGNGEKVTHSTLIRLKALNGSLNNHCPTPDIDRCAVELILQKKDSEQDSAWAMRVSDLRRFNAFLRALGFQAYQIPKKYNKKVYVPFKPYIFSKSELLKITETIDRKIPCRRSAGNYNPYPVLIRILIGSGLRIGEALSLRIKDVDVDNKLLVVYESKNKVSRYAPMSESLFSIVAEYISEHPHKSNNEQYLFVSPYTGTRYSYDAMKYMFKKVYEEAGVRTSKGRLPRIHDVRHTFCTLSLNQMLESGMNLYVAVPILAAYVGHVNLIDTERYIHLTEHSYDDFLRKQGSLRALIPEVNV